MIFQDDCIQFDDLHTTARICLDKKTYSKSAVLKVSYWLSKDLWFEMNEGNDHYLLTVRLRAPTPSLAQPRVKNIDEWMPEIFEALVDFQLRAEVQAETASIREIIIAKAFAESGILEDGPPGIFED